MLKGGEICCVSNTVGEKIRQLRVLRGLSQENVAEEIGMSYGNYGKIERGEIDVSSSHLIAIAKALNINASEFFNNKPKPNIKDLNTEYGYATKEEVADLAHAILKITKTLERLEEHIPKKVVSKKQTRKK